MTSIYGTKFSRKDDKLICTEVDAGRATDRDRPADLVIIPDVAIHQRAQAALKRTNGLLEARGAERTTGQAVAKERAEESDRIKSDFLADISHELRTPLNEKQTTSTVIRWLMTPLANHASKPGKSNHWFWSRIVLKVYYKNELHVSIEDASCKIRFYHHWIYRFGMWLNDYWDHGACWLVHRVPVRALAALRSIYDTTPSGLPESQARTNDFYSADRLTPTGTKAQPKHHRQHTRCDGLWEPGRRQ